MNTPVDRASNRVRDLVLDPCDNERLANLCGQLDEHLHLLERRLGVEVNHRGNAFRLIGDECVVETAEQLIRDLYQSTIDTVVTPQLVHLHLQEAGAQELVAQVSSMSDAVRIKRGLIKARGANQRRYLHCIQNFDINFGIGPAGTGKTYLAVACAVASLENERVRRVCLVRPAVEAGERLGFLPGDMAQKIDPYLRPLYDALYEMLGFERVAKLIERNVIEVAPLAFMRGRTLNDSFIILDEAQNTTPEQMKMFLTRIGFGSTTVITGDITQTDLPRNRDSGLRQIIDILKGTEGISFTFFESRDVVRHPLVGRILDAYSAFESHKERTPNES